MLIVNLDNTVLNVALPTLVRDLRATSSQLQWIVDAYALVFAGLLLLAGSLADRVGRKRTFLAGLVVFAGGSAWAAFSGSVAALIAARASMGIGAALMMPSTLSIITDVPRCRTAAAGDRLLGGDQRGRVCPWAHGRRGAACSFLVGLGLPDQRADRRGRLAVPLPIKRIATNGDSK
jgi:MFS family permease